MAIVYIDHRLSLIRLSTDLLNLLHIFKEGVPNWFEYVQQIKSNPPIREGVLFANPYLTSTNKLLFVFFLFAIEACLMRSERVEGHMCGCARHAREISELPARSASRVPGQAFSAHIGPVIHHELLPVGTAQIFS